MFIMIRRDEEGRLVLSGTSQKETPEDAVRDIVSGYFGDPLWIVEIADSDDTLKRHRVYIKTRIGEEA